MLDTDKNEFKSMLDHVMDIYEKEHLSKSVLITWWTVLQDYEIEQVKSAFNAHIRTSKFSPKPADVVELINQSYNLRPLADEAWAMIPQDEESSCVMSDEMSEAYGIARPLMLDGDKIAARMAFKQAYERIVNHNTMNGINPKWFPSFGHNPESREVALKEAVRKGRLTQEHYLQLSPPKPNEQVDKAINELQLLTSKEELTEEEKTRNKSRMAEIRQMLQRNTEAA